jgi:hypothetical protein
VWVVTGGLYYDNGPSDAEAGIDIPLGTGSGPMWIYCSPGDIFEPYHGINLFFNHSTLPQISGYEATACAGGPAKAYLGDSLGLSGTVPAAGTVRAVVDGYEILLETFLLARPDCGSGDTDLVAPFSKTPDGTTDFGGVFMLTVTPVPLLSIARTTTNTVVLWWPSHPTGWALQENTNSVSSVNWSNVLATPLDDGSHKIIIVDPPTGNRFYRLFKP